MANIDKTEIEQKETGLSFVILNFNTTKMICNVVYCNICCLTLVQMHILPGPY